MNRILLITLLITLAACSSESNDNDSSDHIWKNQTDALDKAKDLSKQLEDEFKKKMEQMEKTQE